MNKRKIKAFYRHYRNELITMFTFIVLLGYYLTIYLLLK